MKFFLTIYICSSIAGNCFTHNEYPKPIATYYDCVRTGLSESYDILYGGKVFTQDEVENMELYPKFWCEKIIVPKEKPEQKPTI